MPSRTVLRRARGLVGLVFALTAAACATSEPAVLVATTPADPSPTASQQMLVDEPGPDTATGQVARGFPTTLVPVPKGAEVLVSSAQPAADGTLSISLNVRSQQDAPGLLAAVSAPLLAAGFTQSPPAQPDPSLAAQASFSRSDGKEFVLVGILDRDGRRTMTLGGTVKP